MVRIILAAFFPLAIAWAWNCSAAFDNREWAARSAAMADCVSACGDDAAGSFYSPANAVLVRTAEFVFTGSQVYPAAAGDESIWSGAMAAVFTLRGKTGPASALGLGFHLFGMGSYRERLLLLSYGISLFNRINLGLSARSHELYIAGCGLLDAFAFDMGVQTRISHRWVAAAVLRNILRASLTEEAEDLPGGGEISFSYRMVEGNILTVGVDHGANRPFSLAFGLEQRVSRFCRLRAGFRNESARFSAGVGLEWKSLLLDQTLLYQEMLGPQYMASLRFRILPPEIRTEMNLLRKERFSGERLDINTASEKDFQLLPRIGPSTAKRIVEFRNENGPFAKCEDLMRVKRIGPKTFALIKDYVTVTASTATTPVKRRLGLMKEHDLILVGIPPMTALRIVDYMEESGSKATWKEISLLDGLVPEDLHVLQELFALDEVDER
jgi:competence ComEA-like helix-hairpin-helix protein